MPKKASRLLYPNRTGEHQFFPLWEANLLSWPCFVFWTNWVYCSLSLSLSLSVPFCCGFQETHCISCFPRFSYLQMQMQWGVNSAKKNTWFPRYLRNTSCVHLRARFKGLRKYMSSDWMSDINLVGSKSLKHFNVKILLSSTCFFHTLRILSILVLYIYIYIYIYKRKGLKVKNADFFFLHVHNS